MSGSIYDLGYRGYDGPRLGRRHAVSTLVRHSARSVFGIGRNGRAKILPVVCVGFPALIALILVGVRALAAQVDLGDVPGIPGHDGLYAAVSVFPLLFVAAQAPELLGRDQRYRVLTLYFSRALRRTDYALAKLAAMSIGTLTILLVPHLLLGAGTILLDPDIVTALRTEAATLPPVLGSSVVIAVTLAAVALLAASFTPRRAYATAAIFGVFIIPGIIAAIVIAIDPGRLSDWIIMIDIGSLLDGVNAWFFGVRPSAEAALSVVHPHRRAGHRSAGRCCRRRARPRLAVPEDRGMTAGDPRLAGWGVPAAPPRPLDPTAAVELQVVSRWYGNVVAVNDISFTLRPGVTGLLGPNGAGKSTLLHLIAGLLRPSAGQVAITGRPAWRDPAIYRRVGLVPEREAVYPFLTGRDFALLNARLQGLPDPEAAADRAVATVELG